MGACMSLIRINDVHATMLIANACSVQFVPRIHHCIATYDESDKLVGGNLYTDYWGNGGSCQLHTACFNKRAVSKAMMYLAFDYPFRQLKVGKIFGLVPERNIAARNFDLKLGFRIEYLAAGVFNHVDGVNGMYLMSMTKDECKWLDMKMPYIEYAPENKTSPIPWAAMPTYNNLPAE
jgi:hypothetical protein